MLNNNLIKLRYFETKDLPYVSKIRSLPETYDYFFEFEPYNINQQLEWWESSYKKSNEKNFIIVDTNDVFLGTISLVNIDMRNRKAELGRFFIVPEYRKKFYGKESIILLLEYSFQHLNLNKVYLEVFASNLQAINLYKNIGFEKEGTYHQHIFKRGSYHDVEIYSIFNILTKS